VDADLVVAAGLGRARAGDLDAGVAGIQRRTTASQSPSVRPARPAAGRLPRRAA
jgi:hypothetical protein